MFDVRDHGGNYGGGNGGKLNIYTQLTEPVKKEGIWVKTDKKYSKIINDLELWFANSWNDPSLKNFADLPELITYFASCNVGTKIYICGGSNTTSETSTNVFPFYCYDTITDSWSKLADVPAARVSGSLDYYNGKLYYIGGFANTAAGTTGVYCYDIAKNTWSNLASMPVPKARHGSCVYQDKIICIGGYNTGIQSTCYMYDITNNTWSALASAPVGLQTFACEVINGIIYCLGGAESSNNYTYDILNNKWTSLGTSQFLALYYPGSAVVGTDIYVYGGKSSSASGFYIYHTATNTREDIVNPPFYGTNNHAKLEFTNGRIYALGFSDSSVLRKIVRTFSFNSKVFDDKTLILYRVKPERGTYQTELVTPKPNAITGINLRFASYFDNVYMYLNDALQENLETYYGDGSQWIKFKGGA